jgi:uncharacterized phage-associated protein
VPQLDARAVANLILREAWKAGERLSHLKLQKLLFLCHAFLLTEKNKDLIRGEFIAWKLGPVHRDVYDAFKSYGKEDIDEFARGVNLLTGKKSDLPEITDKDVRDVVVKVVTFYGSWSAGKLVQLTHAKDGPWHQVVASASSQANVGLRISNDVIQKNYKYLWFGAKRDLQEKEDEDSPLVA